MNWRSSLNKFHSLGFINRKSFTTLKSSEIRTTSGDKIDPWHGSYHWIYERALSVATLGLFTAAFFIPTPFKFLDLSLGVVLPLHCHIGFSSIITDYLPKRKFPIIYPISRALLWAGTLGTIYGLYLFNTKDVGIIEATRNIWKAKDPKKDQD